MTRPTFKDFKAKALKDDKVRKEYDVLKPEYVLRKQLIELRRAAGLTQEEVAERMGTKKASISRLESVNADHSPKLSTLEKYAQALGYQLEVKFKPEGDRA